MAPKENIKGPGIHTEELTLFSKPPVNVGEEKIAWVEYCPTFMSSGEYSSVQFHIPGNSSQYIDMGHSELYVKVKVKKWMVVNLILKKKKQQYLLI